MIAIPAPVTAASLETAAAVWECVLDMRQNAQGNELGLAVAATFEALGTATLRWQAMTWVPMIDAAWIVADTDPTSPHAGQYGGAFDWEFIPEWIVANVDWSDPHSPFVRKPAPRDPWDGVDGETRHMLFAHGFTPEQAGGGCMRLELYRPNGSNVIVTDIDGTDMPTATTWAVGVYPPCSDDDDTPEALQMFHSDPATLSLAQAVGAAIAIADLCAVAPAAPAFVAMPRFAMSLTILHTLHVDAPNELLARKAAERFIADTMADAGAADGWNSAQTDGCSIVGQVGPDIEALTADDVTAL